MHHGIRKFYNTLSKRLDRWRRWPEALDRPGLQLSRRATILGVIASIAIIGHAQARATHGGAAAPGGGGGALATLTLKTINGSNIAANQPFQFGLPIAPATMATSSKLTCADASSNPLTVQEDNRVVDADGFVRWVMVTSVLVTAPGAPSTTVSIGTTSGAPDTSNAITSANLLAQTISADTFECQNEITMPNGDVYVAKATDGLAASTTWTYGSAFNEGVWRQGPLCTEFVVYVPYVKTGTPHAYLYVQMHIAAYKASGGAWNNATNPITGVKVYCFNENGFNGTSAGWAGTPQDYAYDWIIKVGAGTLSTALSLNGGAGAGTLTLAGTSGNDVQCDRSSGTFALNTTTPNSSDAGKAIVETGGTGRGWISYYSSSTRVYLTVPSTTPFAGTSIVAANWKKMGVYHYWGSRVTNTIPAIGGSWWGANHDLVYPILTTAYLEASQMVPKFRLNNTQATAPDLTRINADGAHPCGASLHVGYIKDYNNNEGATGDINHIGVFTYEQATAAIFWDSATQHANARKLIIYNAEAAHKKPYWFRNEEYGTLNSIADGGCYRVMQGGASQKQINYPTTNAYAGTTWFSFAGNHSGQVSVLPYIVTGDLYHLQNLVPLCTQYPMQGSDYGIYDTTSTRLTISGSTLTGTGASMPTQTGEPVQVKNVNNFLPQVGGSTIAGDNRYYYRAATGNTGSLYDTYAHAQAGGATGLVTFSSSSAGTYLNNGYAKQAFTPGASDAQTRSDAWNARSMLQLIGLLPSSPVSASVVFRDMSVTQARRLTTATFAWYNTNFTTNVNYNSLNVRFLTPHNGTNSGQWQMNYLRQTLVNGLEMGVQSPASSNLASFLDWTLADAIGWHTDATIYSPNYCSSYYVHVRANQNNIVAGSAFTYSDVIDRAIGTPWLTNRTGAGGNPVGGGPAFGYFVPSNRTCSIASVAVPSAVVVTLSGNWFDTAVKSKYEGIGWFATYSGNSPMANGGPGTVSGFGRIVTVDSATQITVDFTVTSAYGFTITPMVPPTGAGLKIVTPLLTGTMPTNVAAGDVGYYGSYSGDGNGIGVGADSAYPYLDRTSLELAKQRGINVGAANATYTAAVAEMTGRGFPTTWSNATGSAVKANWQSRV